LFACLVLLGIVEWGRAEQPAPEVPVARVAVREWTDHEEFTGRAEPAAQVDLRARVTGYLIKAAEPGTEVKKGDVLFEIDSRVYRAELDRAEAAVKLAEARLKLADANHTRAKKLLGVKGISQEEFDRALAEHAVAEAEVRAAQAGRVSARLNLDFTRVLAPIAGRIGRLNAQPGNLVKADETTLATLVSRDPMYVSFDVDERSALRLLRSFRAAREKAAKVPVAAGLADEEGFPRRGVVDFTDNRVNPSSGTLGMRAVLSNKDGILMPGLFVRVRVPMAAPYKALTVPEQAVLVEDGERFVLVINDKNVIERRTVTLGPSDGGLRVVTRGLKAGERVAIGRLRALRPGTAVRPSESDKPAPKGRPASEDRPASAVSSARAQGAAGILVESVYPGASAEVVSDAVRSPIEQQINGIENLRHMRSRCTSDGRYTLVLTFAPGVDLRVTQVLAQNRVSLALPTLPEAVKTNGVSVKRGASGVLMVVTLSSPSGMYDSLYLSNYAHLRIKDELARLPGVGDVTLLGQSDYRLRVHLDPDKLAALGLTPGEVAIMIKKEKIPGGLLGSRGGATTLDDEKLAGLIVKAGREGRVVRLRDVARLDVGARERSRASLGGKPAVALVIRPLPKAAPQKMTKALRDMLSRLRKDLPQGLDLAVPFDFTADAEYLLLDADVQAGDSAARSRLLERAESLLRRVQGVQDVLAMSENPFDVFGGGASLLVSLTPVGKRKAGRDEVARALRLQFHEIKEWSVRVRDLSRGSRTPGFGYPLDLAVRGPKASRVREFAKALAARLGKDKQVTDVWANPDSAPCLQHMVDIDRTAAKLRGVSVQDILTALEVQAGALHVNGFSRFGRNWRVQVQAASNSGDLAKDLRRLQVRGGEGRMIPLSAIVKVREVEAPLALDFLDSWPMVQVTANPSPGVKLENARKRCETLAEEVRKELRLPADYRLFWLP
jgi:RND family efflux transporter MFP subunit